MEKHKVLMETYHDAKTATIPSIGITFLRTLKHERVAGRNLIVSCGEMTYNNKVMELGWGKK
jgi:hypothetical protein